LTEKRKEEKLPSRETEIDEVVTSPTDFLQERKKETIYEQFKKMISQHSRGLIIFFFWGGGDK
jgi:hypothetical protein